MAEKSVKYDDPTHYLHLHPFNHPGIVLVSHPLTEDNYETWSRAMLLALQAKNKIKFIDGTLTPPDSPSSAEALQWSHCNGIVISWLLNCISKDISSSVLYCDSAYAIWVDLKDRYSQINGPRLFKLKQDTASLVQGFYSVTAYFAKLKSLWDELLVVQFNPTCTCAAHKEILAQ
ncbi:uncharacterized protein LOC131158529 [Malania oleifera]|uniref:uncharacterized protein LOC131158529 n=1 Tax=Malania oleifera TaxID=397392 RepID=UPI0025AE4BB9|nr:uncharacterized protein LOC131158529 [Malania oleifera]